MSDCQYTVCNNTVVVLMFRPTTGSSLKAVLYSVTCISFLIFYVSMKVMCTDRHSFKGLFSRTTRVSWYQKVKLRHSRQARDDGVEK